MKKLAYKFGKVQKYLTDEAIVVENYTKLLAIVPKDMIVLEHNKINSEPYLRVTSDKENHFVKVKGSENEPTNEIMIKGEITDLEFEEVFVEPVEEELEEVADTVEEGNI